MQPYAVLAMLKGLESAGIKCLSITFATSRMIKIFPEQNAVFFLEQNGGD